MAFEDVRDFITALRDSGDLVEITPEVDWDLEMGAVGRRLAEVDGPAAWFRTIKDYAGHSALLNPLATWRRTALALGLAADAPVRAIYRAYEERETQPIPPVEVDGGVCQQNVVTGDRIDLADVPAPMLHE